MVKNGGRRVVDQRLLLGGRGRLDDDQVVVHLPGLGVDGGRVRHPVEQEPLALLAAGHLPGRAVTPGDAELGLGELATDPVDVVRGRWPAHGLRLASPRGGLRTG